VSGDHLLQCAECNTQFVWTAGERRAGAPPVLCPGCRRLAPAPGRQRGVVKWYSRGKGYGFITPAQGADVFVHKSGLAGEPAALRVGQLVEFSVSHAARGAQAEQVVVLETEETPRPAQLTSG
jgi:CspA family cold shock protein